MYRLNRLAATPTLSVQKVTDGNRVARVRLDRSVTEHLLSMPLGADAHVLLAERSRMGAKVGVLLRVK